MATLKLYRNKLKHNYKVLKKIFHKSDIDWALTTKLLCGNEEFLKEVIALGAKEVCDSRVSNLERIKRLSPKTRTMYIKPPPKKSIPNIVRFADVSLNSELETIKMLGREARKQKKVHEIIIMIEMGDLREGVLGPELVDFYSKVFKLKGIKIIGLGTNLNCLHGVLPSQDKMTQLALYRKIIELQFKRKLPLISGGSTVTIPLLLKKQLPKAVNHFRVGEALFFGADLVNKGTLKGMFPSVFELEAEIIEINEKPVVPNGELDTNPSGEVFEVNPDDFGKKVWRAIIDVGKLDVPVDHVYPVDEGTSVVGASSDMLVVEIDELKDWHQVGSVIKLDLDYMGILGIMNSRYVEKVVI